MKFSVYVLHNEELHSLYHSPNIVRVIKYRRLGWARHVARMEEGKSAFKILTRKPSGKRPRSRWEDNIRMDLVLYCIVLYCIVLYCIVLMGWSLRLNVLRPF